ncbi:MAG: hypothetical protein R3B99_13360 [Polyangiales bacterium]
MYETFELDPRGLRSVFRRRVAYARGNMPIYEQSIDVIAYAADRLPASGAHVVKVKRPPTACT